MAKALPENREPVFTLELGHDIYARLIDGKVFKGKKHGKVTVKGETLDLRDGGHVTLAHRQEFDLGHKFSIVCRLYFERAGQMPVILSCGQWKGAGWFLQSYSGGWRWYLGGVHCDGGKSNIGRWIHLVATFDGHRAHVFQDGNEVASVPCIPNRTPWPGPLFIGQYSAGPGSSYQVPGFIKDVKIFHRAIPAAEAKDLFESDGL